MIKYKFKNNSVCSNFFLGISTSDGIFHDVSKLEVVSLLMEKYFEYGEVKGDYRDVLGDVGLVNDECILLGMPVYYEKNISYGTFDYELDYAYTNCSSDNICDFVVSSLYGEKHCIESSSDIDKIVSNWGSPNSFGAVLLTFYLPMNPGIIFRLLIDTHNERIVLFAGNSISVYCIRSMNSKGLVTKRSSYGSFSNSYNTVLPNKRYLEYLEFEKDNPGVSYEEFIKGKSKGLLTRFRRQ